MFGGRKRWKPTIHGPCYDDAGTNYVGRQEDERCQRRNQTSREDHPKLAFLRLCVAKINARFQLCWIMLQITPLELKQNVLLYFLINPCDQSTIFKSRNPM